MGLVKDLLARKDGAVYTVEATATVLEAIRLMNDKHIGALVVTRAGRPEGIFSERDVLRRVVAQEERPAQLRVEGVMTSDVIYCSPATPVEEVGRIMRDRRIRHLPVIGEDGELLGVISIGDVNAWHSGDQEATIHFLSDYIHGRV